MRTRTAMIGGTLAIRPGLRGGSVITVSRLGNFGVMGTSFGALLARSKGLKAGGLRTFRV
jgi:hypothetical protein